MVSNQSTLADESGEYDPWIEIHNATFSEVDLEGLALTGDPEDESKWVFGPGLRVPPKGYLIVWADGQTRARAAAHRLPAGSRRLVDRVL